MLQFAILQVRHASHRTGSDPMCFPSPNLL